MNLEGHFSRFLGADPDRLHFAAHSHHLWPDVTLEAQRRAWEDAAALADRKWERIFGEVVPATQRAIAGVLGLADPAAIAFAPNTHEFLVRILSCLPSPARILATDGEFHSFTRQTRRLEEEGLAEVERVAVEPFASFGDRFLAAVAGGGYDLMYVSHVFYDSGFVTPDLPGLVAAVPEPAFAVIDGYHGFMALPTDLAPIAPRAFYVAGGYKYAMAGEGACFLACPPAYGLRPVNTGWFASFGELASGRGGPVGYAGDGRRFAGATIDFTGLYRLRAVLEWLGGLGVSVADIHAHVGGLQRRFLDGLDPTLLDRATLIPDETAPDRGHFLTFRRPDAAAVHDLLDRRNVVTDYRADRLRIGFGLYHGDADVDELLARLAGGD